MLHADQDASSQRTLPEGKVVVIEILTSRIGAPAFIDPDGSLVMLTNEEEQNVTAALLNDPTLAERLKSVIRLAIEDITGIDGGLPDNEWWFAWNKAMAVNALATPLHVLTRATATAEKVMGSADE